MTVIYLKDGRIEVKDPHDALLLSLAGIKLETEHEYNITYVLDDGWIINIDGVEIGTLIEAHMPLHIPADVANNLIKIYSISGKQFVSWRYFNGGSYFLREGLTLYFTDSAAETASVHMRRHNNRWNLLPDIEME